MAYYPFGPTFGPDDIKKLIATGHFSTVDVPGTLCFQLVGHSQDIDTLLCVPVMPAAEPTWVTMYMDLDEPIAEG